MSILSRIKNVIREAIGVDDTKNVKPATSKKPVVKPNSVVKTDNIPENEDTFKKTTTQVSDTAKQPKNQRTVGQIKQSIENKCRANNLNFSKLRNEFGHIAGDFREHFESLPEEEQVKILLVIEHEIDDVIALQKKHGKSTQIDNTEVVIASAKTKAEAEENGISEQELEEKSGDINEELGKDFRKLGINERRKRMDNLAKARKEEFEENLRKDLAKIPEEERAEYEKRKREEFRITEENRFNQIIATQDSETALNAIAMMPAENMCVGMSTVLNTRVDKAEKTRIADNADFEFTEGILKTQNERGEKASADRIEGYTAKLVMYKSTAAATQYQDDYMKRRQAYENGEDVPAYLDKEFFTASAKGIGEGALNNTNMTTEEKAEFISKWKEDARNFDDYEVVTKDVNEALQNKPENKELAEKVKLADKKRAEAKAVQNKESERRTSNSKKSSTVKYSSNTLYNTPSKTQNSEGNKKSQVSSDGDSKIGSSTANKTTNLNLENKKYSTEVTKHIQKNGIDSALNEYDSRVVITTVLNNPSLKYMRPSLTPLIKSYDLQSLKKLAKDCSTSAFLYICRIVNKEYVEELKNERQDLCYSARQIVENMEKQNA